MPPPASYIDITALPFTRVVTQAEFNAANEIWFRYVAASTIVLGGTTNLGGTFTPRTRLYLSDGTTQRAAGDISGIDGWWWYLTAGTYYILVTRSGGGASNFDFTCSFGSETANPTTFSNGSYLVNDDDSDQWPACLFSQTGEILGFIAAIPTGETGVALPNGYTLWHDRFAKYLADSVALFNPTFGLDVSIAPSPALSGWPFICTDGTDFYVINSTGVNAGKVFKITSAGVITDIGVTIPFASGDATAVGISRDATTFYWAEWNNGTIQKYVGGVASTFYTVPGFDTVNDWIGLSANQNPGEIIVQPDGTVVTWWYDDSGSANLILHIAANGTLINTWSFSFTNRIINHLHADSSSTSTHVRIWFFLDFIPGEAIFARLRLSDGTLEDSVTTPMFSDTANSGSGSLQTEKFGPGDSCPFVVLMSGSTPPPPVHHNGTLYFMEPNKRFDELLNENVKIPNPFFRTALIGD